MIHTAYRRRGGLLVYGESPSFHLFVSSTVPSRPFLTPRPSCFFSDCYVRLPFTQIDWSCFVSIVLKHRILLMLGLMLYSPRDRGIDRTSSTKPVEGSSLEIVTHVST